MFVNKNTAKITVRAVYTIILKCNPEDSQVAFAKNVMQTQEMVFNPCQEFPGEGKVNSPQYSCLISSGGEFSPAIS